MLNEKLKTIISDLSSSNDSNIFNNICLALIKVISADYVFIANIVEGNSKSQTVSVASKQGPLPNFVYELQETPCDNVLQQGVCSHIDNIQHLYPNDELLIKMGINGYVGVPLCVRSDDTNAILVALYQNPIADVDEVEALFLLFSGFIEKELVKQEYLLELELVNQIVHSSSDGIVICDANNKVIYINKNFTEITQYSRNEVYGKSPSLLKSGQHEPDFYREMWHRLNTEGKWSGEIINKRKNGEHFPEFLSLRTVLGNDGKISRYIGQFSDMTEQKLAEKRLYKQTNFDSLTALANRNLLLATIDNTTANPSGTLLVFDIDSFRSLNTLYDQWFGDQVLITVADRIRSISNPAETLARLSNDSFAIFVPGLTSFEAINKKISAVLAQFEQQIRIQGIDLQCSVSLGAATLELMDGGADLLFKAEQAHQSGKDRNRNSFKLYDKTIQAELNRTNELKEALSRAIANDEIEVYYQPLVAAKSRKVEGLEALARWTLNGEAISPDVFIPLAEHSGQIQALGELVLHKTCVMVNRLDSEGYHKVNISVNRSVYEFSAQSTEHVDWLSTLEEYDIAPNRICFELTESLLATESSNSFETLKHLKQQGCAIAIDDFGTGYSSLNYLTRIDANHLKIDRSFIKQLFQSSEASILINTIISMAKALGMKVVAEGVETTEQVNYLCNINCDYLQGYYFAKPVAAQQLLLMLKQHPHPGDAMLVAHDVASVEPESTI